MTFFTLFRNYTKTAQNINVRRDPSDINIVGLCRGNSGEKRSRIKAGCSRVALADIEWRWSDGISVCRLADQILTSSVTAVVGDSAP